MSDPSKPAVTVSKSVLIWGAVIAVVLIVVAALLGGWIGGTLASSGTDAAPAPTATEGPAEPGPSPTVSGETEIDDELQDLIDEILPAGADVRAGRGAPAADHGATGDVYIDLTNSDVYVRRANGWERVGNLRVDTAENLRGPQGVPGSPGDRGAQGQAGADGTQVVLGADAPDEDSTCEPDGSVYIDTSTSTYYSCVDAGWVLFGADDATDG